MINSRKTGVTLSSLIIYIVLFTSFAVFVSNISSNMNERVFDNRGEAINYSSLNKLQYNIDDSAKRSTDVTATNNKIVYSNGDSYLYIESEKIILKNGGILCQNVESFEVNLEQGTGIKKVNIQIEFNKYMNNMSRTITSCVEVV